MSKNNKVNKDAYVQRGRLTPDELARERMKQGEIAGRAKGKENVIGKMPSRPAERGPSRPRNEREE
jgi:hypothetical protein